MKEFSYLDYYTEYSCSGKINKRLSVASCFSKVFNRIKDNATESYKIIIYKKDQLCQVRGSNMCFLTQRQIHNHLKQAQEIYPFEFRIGKRSNYKGKYDVYTINLKLINVPSLFHKYLLVWVRYMYEFPYNVILLDAYKLKQEKRFRYTSIANLFNLILGCMDYSREIHQIPVNNLVEFLKKNVIRKRLTIEDMTLNKIYKVRALRKEVIFIPEKINTYSPRDIEYWNNQIFFEKYRKPVYLDAFNKVKK